MMLLEIWIKIWEEQIVISIGLKINKTNKNKGKAKIRLITRTTFVRVIRKLSNFNNNLILTVHEILKMGLKQITKIVL